MVRPRDVLLLIGLNAALVTGMWVRHGGLAAVQDPASALTAGGQLTALLGTLAALVGLLLMSRAPWLERVLGGERMMRWHRAAGFACLWLLVAHAALTTLGWAAIDGVGVLDEVAAMLSTWDVLIATVALGLLAVVAVSSVRAARRRLEYETWYGLHLYAYLAIALAFAHQLSLGGDLRDDPVAVGYWLGLYALALTPLLACRVLGPVVLTLRHRPRVANVVREAPDAVSIYLTGRHLERLEVRAGQWFQVRFLTGGGWWRHHPFSLSAAPNGRFLRFTIKDLGDDSHRLLSLPLGVPVFLEGPYGDLTAARAEGANVTLVAGGIGITPLRAVLEELAGSGKRITLLYRAGAPEDVVLGHELDLLARRSGAAVRYLVGHRGSPEMPHDPLRPEGLAGLIPDLPEQDVLVCGPGSFSDRVVASLRALGVPTERIHVERLSL